MATFCRSYSSPVGLFKSVEQATRRGREFSEIILKFVSAVFASVMKMGDSEFELNAYFFFFLVMGGGDGYLEERIFIGVEMDGNFEWIEE